jgi:hypothetical protein
MQTKFSVSNWRDKLSIQTISPPAPCYKIDDFGNSIQISTGDARKITVGKIIEAISIFVIIAFGIPGLTVALYRISKGNYVVVFFQLIIETLVILFFIWRFFFKEIITIDNNSIIVKYKSVWYSPSKRYLAEHISDLRASPIPPTTVWSGRIAFDYGGQTFYFGSRLSESEAKQIITVIQRKFQRYQSSQ